MTATTRIMTVADTCRELVTPRLTNAEWGSARQVIGERRTFTNGRIIVTGGRVRRGKQKRADYLLCYRRDYPLAVLEAKELGLPAESGVQQANEYDRSDCGIDVLAQDADDDFRMLVARLDVLREPDLILTRCSAPARASAR